MVRSILISISLIACMNSIALCKGVNEKICIEGTQWREDWVYPDGVGEKGPVVEKNGPGIFEVYIKNKSGKNLSLENIEIDGKSGAELRDSGIVVWYQLKPAQLAPGKIGCVLIRFRQFDKIKKIRYLFNSGLVFERRADSKKSAKSWRVESVGFSPNLRDVYFYFKRRPGAKVKSIKSLEVMGLGGYTKKFITKGFEYGISALKLTTRNEYKTGEYLFIKAKGDDGSSIFSLFRIGDGFVPLGTFDTNSVDIPALVEAGMNTLFMHAQMPENIIDQANRLGIKVATHLRFQPPAQSVLNKDNIWAYLIVDEPDMHDWHYYKNHPEKDKNTPSIMKVGYHGQLCVETYYDSKKAEPLKAVGMNLDMTFKPHNWYIYGQIPDIMLHDNYPLMHNEPLESVCKSQRAVFSAAAPNPTVNIYQNCHWKNGGIGRRMAVGELVRLMYYPLGEGAKGLIGWWNVTAPESWSTDTYPDLWVAQSNVFRSLNFISPLLSISCPMDIFVKSEKDVWVRCLFAGEQATVILVVNQNYVSEKEGFTQKNKEKVEVVLAKSFARKYQRAIRLNVDKYHDLPMRNSKDSVVVEIGNLIDGALIVLCEDKNLPEKLAEANMQRLTSQARRLLVEKQYLLEKKARENALKFDLFINRSENAVLGQSACGQIYPVENENFPQLVDQKFNAYEWYYPKGKKGQVSGVQWDVTARTEGRYLFAMQCYFHGAETVLELHNEQNKLLYKVVARNGLNIYEMPIDSCGKYKIKIIQQKDINNAERSGKIAQKAWFISELSEEDLVSHIKR